MKKSLLVGLALILGATLSGCQFFQIMDGDGMERESQYPKAEQLCIDNAGEISTDDDGNQICLFEDGMQCPLAAIEEGDCFLINQGGGEWISVATDMRNEQGGEIQQWNEGGDIQDICFFPDESFCYLEDLAAGACEKGDMKYEDDIVEELARCDTEGENIVCGKDGNTYYNRCYLDFAGVEEETELAEVVDGECVFG